MAPPALPAASPEQQQQQQQQQQYSENMLLDHGDTVAMLADKADDDALLLDAEVPAPATLPQDEDAMPASAALLLQLGRAGGPSGGPQRQRRTDLEEWSRAGVVGGSDSLHRALAAGLHADEERYRDVADRIASYLQEQGEVQGRRLLPEDFNERALLEVRAFSQLGRVTVHVHDEEGRVRETAEPNPAEDKSRSRGDLLIVPGTMRKKRDKSRGNLLHLSHSDSESGITLSTYSLHLA